MNRVSIVRCGEYDEDRLTEDMLRHFKQTGADAVFKDGLSVLVKPNLLMKKAPGQAVTTHPAVVYAVIRAIQSCADCHITIADSPGGPFSKMILESIYRATGMAEVAARTGAQLNFDVSHTEKQCPQGVMCRSFPVMNCVAQSDVIVDIAKLKTHGMTKYSGAVKNLYGVIPGLTKAEYHFRFQRITDFSNMLVDLCECVRPAVSVMDAVIGMEGDGPSGGVPRKVGMTLCSLSPYALDFAAAKCIGYEPREVEHLRVAMDRGIDCETELCGDEPVIIEGYQKPAHVFNDHSASMVARMPAPFRKAADRLLSPRPVVDKSKCVACGECAVACPAKVISIDKKAKIAYAGCIKCYCCQELCPVKAIKIRSTRLWKL